jgi:Tol biopolymer transport system component
VAADIAAAMALPLLPNDGPGGPGSSDFHEFLRAGIPAIQLMGIGGDPALSLMRMGRWGQRIHQPGDVIDEGWDWAGPRQMAQLYLLLGLRVATAAEPPRLRSSSPYFAGADRGEPLERLTYSSYRPAGWDLYLYGSPGTEPRRLTDHPALDYEAAFSPDGRWIVFTSERDGNPSLYVLDLEAEDPPRLLVRSHAMQDQAALSPDGRRLAFVSTHGGDADIYLLPFVPDSTQDVSDAVNLTDHPGGDFRPAFSPDGMRIAFSSDRDGAFSRDPTFPFVVRHEGDIYVVNVDGSGLQRVTDSPGWDGSPAWSDDGKSLLFYSERDERLPYRLHQVRLEGGEVRPIGPADRPGLSPVLGGNGSVVFATWTEQGPAKRWQAVALGADGEVHEASDPAMDCLGPSIHRGSGAMVCHGGPPLTGETVASFPGPLLVAGSPGRFTMGDRTVALSGVRHAFTTPPDPSRGELLVREAPRRISFATETGEGPSGLLDLDEIAGVAGGVISHMRYTHDGEWVTFTVGPFGGPPTADADVWRVRTDGSGLTNLTPNTPGNDGLAEFSADGSRFVFRSGRTGNFDIFLADADGSNVRNLTDHPASETFPAFSPRGDQVAFVSDRNGVLDEATGRRTFDVYTLDLEPDGTPSALRQITRNAAQEGHVGYSPDGEWLVYASGKAGLADEAPLVQEVLFNPQMYGEIYAYNLRDRTTVRVTHNKWEDGAPVWAPPARGQARPPVADVLRELIEGEGADAAAARYRELEAAGPDRYRLGEGGLYRLAHRYLGEGREDVADETFRLIALLQPASLRPHLEQAGTLLARGDTAAAVARYREVLARDPEHLRAEWALLRAGVVAEVDVAPDVLAGYAGNYGDPPFNASISFDGARLLIELPGAPAAFPLVPVSDTRFYAGQLPQPLQIRFVPGDDGGTQAIEVKQEGFAATFVRR